MTQNLVTQATGGSKIHEREYDYDAFSNLYQSQVTASNGLQNYETFTYDNLHRLTASDRAYSSSGKQGSNRTSGKQGSNRTYCLGCVFLGLPMGPGRTRRFSIASI